MFQKPEHEIKIEIQERATKRSPDLYGVLFTRGR